MRHTLYLSELTCHPCTSPISLVANAGVSVVKDAVDLTYDDFKYVYDTNVYGQFVCAQQLAKIWIKTGYKEGSIVLTSSMSDHIVNRGIHQVWYVNFPYRSELVLPAIILK